MKNIAILFASLFISAFVMENSYAQSKLYSCTKSVSHDQLCSVKGLKKITKIGTQVSIYDHGRWVGSGKIVSFKGSKVVRVMESFERARPGFDVQSDVGSEFKSSFSKSESF